MEREIRYQIPNTIGLLERMNLNMDFREMSGRRGIEGRRNLEDRVIINSEAEIDRFKFIGSRLAVLVHSLALNK